MSGVHLVLWWHHMTRALPNGWLWPKDEQSRGQKPLHSTLVNEIQFTDKSKTTLVRPLERNMRRAVF